MVLMVQLPVMSSCVFITILCMLLGICVGTIQDRTHVQLALGCQQSVIHAQHRIRLTMQRVYGHGGNLGNECAQHAAALATFGHRDRHGRQVENMIRLLGNYLEPTVRHPSGRERRHHCLSQDLGAILLTRSSSDLSLDA